MINQKNHRLQPCYIYNPITNEHMNKMDFQNVLSWITEKRLWHTYIQTQAWADEQLHYGNMLCPVRCRPCAWVGTGRVIVSQYVRFLWRLWLADWSRLMNDCVKKPETYSELINVFSSMPIKHWLHELTTLGHHNH